MARITGISPQTRNPLLRLVFWYVRRRFGRDVQPLSGYATNPAVLASTIALEVGMERARRLDGRLKQLAELRAAALVGCAFCLDIGSVLVRRAGVTERQVLELDEYRTSDAFSPLEKLVLSYADRVTATPVEIDEDEFTRLREQLDEAQIVELTAAIAHENLRARINHALGYGAEGFSAGGVCARPARHPRPRPAAAVHGAA
ncbi:MAG: carboxymuconolactone decarboxylase family protein [Thermodesulfobacteriota bacterium]